MQPDSVRGHLDALILAVVEPQPQHGYAIIEALQARSGGTVNLPTGTVYPALRRLESAGYLSSSWSATGGRRRRTYRITAAGRRHLGARREQWRTLSTAIDGVLGAG